MANDNKNQFGSSIITPNEARPIASAQLGWSGQGAKNFLEPVTVQEAIQAAGLDFEVVKQPLVRATYDEVTKSYVAPREHLVPSHVATIRTDNDTLLGVVGKDYGIVQNTKAFEFIDFIKEVAGEEPLIETAGALGSGERIFVTARLGKDCYLSPDDAVQNYVVFTNTHNGTSSVSAFFTMVRVVCQNTLTAAIKGAVNKISFRHTSQVNTRLDWELQENRKKALEVFSKGVKFSQTFMDSMLGLKTENVTAEYVKDFAASLFLDGPQMDIFRRNGHSVEGVDEISTKAKNKILALQDCIDFGVGQDLYRGSKLWLFNGATCFFHNALKHSSPEAELVSTMEGDISRKVQRAYERLVTIPA